MRAPPAALLALADQGLLSAGNFLAVALVARLAAQAEFGLFTLAYGILVFATALQAAGVLTPMNLLLPARGDGQRGSYLAGLDRLHLLALLVLPIVALPALLTDHGPLAVATAGAIAARLGHEYQRRLAFALLRPATALAIDAAAALPLLFALALIAGSGIALTATTGMALFAGASLLAWLVGRLALRGARDGRPETGGAILRAHWPQGRWMLAATVVQYVADQVYPFLVAGHLGLIETALLGAARTLVNLGNVALNGIEAHALPRLRQAALAGDPARWRRGVQRTGLLLASAVGAVVVVLAIAPGTLLGAIFGAPYAAAGWMVWALAAILGLRTFGRWCALQLIATGRTGAGLAATTVNAAVTLAAGPWIVAHWGLAGAIGALALNAAITCLALGVAVVRWPIPRTVPPA